MFVAMTRAEKKLYLTEAEGHNIDGSPRYPSRFILDIDQTLLEYTEKPKDGLIEDARGYFAVSEKHLPDSLHHLLGGGTILDIDRDKLAYLIKFDTVKTPRMISFRVKLTAEEKS